MLGRDKRSQNSLHQKHLFFLRLQRVSKMFTYQQCDWMIELCQSQKRRLEKRDAKHKQPNKESLFNR